MAIKGIPRFLIGRGCTGDLAHWICKCGKQADYRADKKFYCTKCWEKRKKRRGEMREIISEMREKEYAIQNAVAAFNKYKQIANGDEEVALRFFEKAFKDEPEDIKTLALKRLNIDITSSATH